MLCRIVEASQTLPCRSFNFSFNPSWGCFYKRAIHPCSTLYSSPQGNRIYHFGQYVASPGSGRSHERMPCASKSSLRPFHGMYMLVMMSISTLTCHLVGQCRFMDCGKLAEGHPSSPGLPHRRFCLELRQQWWRLHQSNGQCILSGQFPRLQAVLLL